MSQPIVHFSGLFPMNMIYLLITMAHVKSRHYVHSHTSPGVVTNEIDHCLNKHIQKALIL